MGLDGVNCASGIPLRDRLPAVRPRSAHVTLLRGPLSKRFVAIAGYLPAADAKVPPCLASSRRRPRTCEVSVHRTISTSSRTRPSSTTAMRLIPETSCTELRIFVIRRTGYCCVTIDQCSLHNALHCGGIRRRMTSYLRDDRDERSAGLERPGTTLDPSCNLARSSSRVPNCRDSHSKEYLPIHRYHSPCDNLGHNSNRYPMRRDSLPAGFRSSCTPRHPLESRGRNASGYRTSLNRHSSALKWSSKRRPLFGIRDRIANHRCS